MEKRKNKIFSFFSIASIAVFLLTIGVYLFSLSSYENADIINEGISHSFRSLLADVTGIVDFSLFEILIISLPAIIAIVVFLAVKSFKERGRALRFLVNLASVALLLFSGHILALGVGYKATPIADRMELPAVIVTEQELYDVASILRDEINGLSDEVSRNSDGVFESGYSYSQLGDLINQSYGNLTKIYDLPPSHNGRSKGIKNGWAMSYLGITGIYTSLTGEANVNTSYPDYVTIFTAAHEMCHQRGILRENEANFVAYLITATSEDINLRYSAALNMFSYITSALYKTDKNSYYELWNSLSDSARADYRAASEVSEKYGDTIFEKISDWVNNLYLESSGDQGIISYSKVVELTLAYYKNKK